MGFSLHKELVNPIKEDRASDAGPTLFANSHPLAPPCAKIVVA